jgi:hypothetical protein
MTVKCGHCKDVHGSVNEVKLCSRGRLRKAKAAKAVDLPLYLVGRTGEETVAELEEMELRG